MEKIIAGLLDNSKSSQLACIEIHNKPIFPFRYEVCTILNINAWELLLKAFILQNYPRVKVINADGTTKPFDECVNFVAGELGKNFSVAKQNIEKIYEYRCNIIHFYHDKVDVLLFSLISKNVLLYHEFLLKYFGIDIANEINLVLLPIGFKSPASPIDFLSNKSEIEKSSRAVQNFVKSIIKSTEQITEEGLDDSILYSFKMALVNENRIKNADIVAAITKDPKKATISIDNVIGKFVFTDDETATDVKKVKIEEESLFKKVYTETYDKVVKTAQKKFPELKLNNKFRQIISKLKNNPKYHKYRYLDIEKQSGMGKDYYTIHIYDEFAKHYKTKG